MATTAGRKPTNLSLDQQVLDEARSLDINLSQAAEEGIRASIARLKAETWKRDNAPAVEDYNRWINENGLPLEKYRRF